MSLSLRKRKGSDNWYLRGAVRGINVDESTGTADRAAAEEIRIRREADLLNRSIHGDTAGTRTFVEAAVQYLGQPQVHLRERVRAKRVVASLGNLPLAAVTDDAIETFLTEKFPGAASSTRLRQRAIIVAIVRYAARRGWCAFPQFRRERRGKGRDRYLTKVEAEKLLAHASPSLRPLVLMLFLTGARLNEALSLDWRHVDLRNGRISFVRTKTGEPRGVPIHERLREALAKLPGDHTGTVFRRPDGQPYADRRGLGGGQIKSAWRGMCRRAEISDFRPHDCRHTWATWLRQGGVDLPTLKELGGWRTASMVLRYAHVNPDHLKPAIQALPSLLVESTTRAGNEKHKVPAGDVDGAAE